jgi:aspartate carbamoyltransferase catalytic subunit
MHPLPRVDELSADLDDLPVSKYFEQAKNGMYVRAALLKSIIGARKRPR